MDLAEAANPTVTLRSRRSNTSSRERQVLPSVPAEEALSFLKDTKGTLTWSVRDLAETLKISRHDAEQVTEAQGYVKRARGFDEWMTTPAGDSVSGAKPPRFTRESVQQAVDSLRERIKQVNKDRKSPFRVTDAVDFGDFLSDRARVQAADVGIGLERRADVASEFQSAPEVQAEHDFLQQLRGRGALLNIKPYVEWMRKRSHLDLY